LFVAVDLPEGSEISESIPPMKPTNRYMLPSMKYGGGPADPPSLRVQRRQTEEDMQRFKEARSVTYVDRDGFTMSIEAFSLKPVKHVCADLVTHDLSERSA
jgi:hypothetical protein